MSKPGLYSYNQCKHLHMTEIVRLFTQIMHIDINMMYYLTNEMVSYRGNPCCAFTDQQDMEKCKSKPKT